MTASQLRYRWRGAWQQRFWEHALRDERDYQNHFYLHFNPVKYGLVKNMADWPYSSFHHWLEQGFDSVNWGSKLEERSFFDYAQGVGE